MNPILMMVALGLIIVVRFVSDQKDIARLVKTQGLTQIQARGIFRSEIYNAMAANKFTALVFLVAVGAAIYIFLHSAGPGKILMPVLTVILGMEIGRFMTRRAADAAIAGKIALLKGAGQTPA